MSTPTIIDDNLDRLRTELEARHNELKTLIWYAEASIAPTLRRKYVTALGGLSDAIRLLGEKE